MVTTLNPKLTIRPWIDKGVKCTNLLLMAKLKATKQRTQYVVVLVDLMDKVGSFDLLSKEVCVTTYQDAIELQDMVCKDKNPLSLLGVFDLILAWTVAYSLIWVQKRPKIFPLSKCHLRGHALDLHNSDLSSIEPIG